MKQIEITEINTIYKKYYTLIFRRCRLILQNEDSAFDATQEVFIKLLKYEGFIENIRGLLFMITRNTCIDILRKNGPVPVDTDTLLLMSNENGIDEQVINKIIIEEIFKQLDAKDKIVFLMRFISRIKIKNISKTMKMSVRAINKRIMKIKNKINEVKEVYDA